MKTGFFQSIYNAIISILKWFAGFFQDGKNSASSKRAITYVAVYLLSVIVFAAINDKFASNSINSQILWGIILIILIGLGAITSEVVGKVFESKFGKKDETPN